MIQHGRQMVVMIVIIFITILNQKIIVDNDISVK